MITYAYNYTLFSLIPFTSFKCSFLKQFTVYIHSESPSHKGQSLVRWLHSMWPQDLKTITGLRSLSILHQLLIDYHSVGYLTFDYYVIGRFVSFKHIKMHKFMLFLIYMQCEHCTTFILFLWVNLKICQPLSGSYLISKLIQTKACGTNIFFALQHYKKIYIYHI